MLLPKLLFLYNNSINKFHLYKLFCFFNGQMESPCGKLFIPVCVSAIMVISYMLRIGNEIWRVKHQIMFYLF